MRWSRGERSQDIEDVRGSSGGVGAGAGLPGLGGGMRFGLGGTIVLLVLSLVFGQNLFALFGDGTEMPMPQSPGLDRPGRPSPSSPEPSAPRGGATRSSSAEEELVDFVSFVLDDVQGTWARELPRAGREYSRARLVLFTNAVRSGCGAAEAAMGPFYCPLDRKVYIDLGFYRALKSRFGAPGDFAQAYVLAHEIGHHVQNLLGIAEQVHQAQRSRPDRASALSVRMELQADCLAGVWANTTAKRDLLEQGDVEEAIGAAAAVGDDRIQKQATGSVNPETWTHGSARQRVAWFKRGLESGQIQSCDSFRVALPGIDR